MHLNQSLGSLVVKQYICKSMCDSILHTLFQNCSGQDVFVAVNCSGHAALLIIEQTLSEDEDCFLSGSLVQRVSFESPIPEKPSLMLINNSTTLCLIWAAVIILHNKTVKVFLNAPLMHRGTFIDLRREIHFLQSERWATKSSSSGVSNLLISGFVTVHPFWLIYPGTPKHFWPLRGTGFHS